MLDKINHPLSASDDLSAEEERGLLELEARYCSHGDTVHYSEPPKLFERCEGSFIYDGAGTPSWPPRRARMLRAAQTARLTVRSPAARASPMTARPQETTWPGTAIPPTAPGTCAARSMTRATPR